MKIPPKAIDEEAEVLSFRASPALKRAVQEEAAKDRRPAWPRASRGDAP